MVPQRVSHSFIGEDGFDTRLRVVEIAPDSAPTFPPSCVVICSFCMGLTPSSG